MAKGRSEEHTSEFVVLLKNTVSQMVYKHAISTVVPARIPQNYLPQQAAEGVAEFDD